MEIEVEIDDFVLSLIQQALTEHPCLNQIGVGMSRVYSVYKKKRVLLPCSWIIYSDHKQQIYYTHMYVWNV